MIGPEEGLTSDQPLGAPEGEAEGAAGGVACR